MNIDSEVLWNQTSSRSSSSMQSPKSVNEEPILGSLRSLLQKIDSNDPAFGGIDDSLIETLRDSIHQSIRNCVSRQRTQASMNADLRRQISQFAYGLTHEINNPLANIAARADLLIREISDPRHQKMLKTILDSSLRAHEMLAEMMLSIQRPSLIMAPMDIRRPIGGWFDKMADRMQSSQLYWQKCISDDALWCNVDWGALSEAMVAAVRNSMDACRTGDTIQLVADRIDNTKDPSCIEIRIAIIDNGPGLSPDAQKLAWDVYYSGRDAGRGLGIGLAKLRRIVEGHNGRVWIDSQENQGCGLEIRLPWHRRV